MNTPHFATMLLIIANVLISIKGFNDFSFFEKYKFNIAGIRKGEQIRMFSSGFLHADFSHLIFNMLTLYFFADVVIYSIGFIKFLIIYLASLIIGNLLSFYFHKNEYHYSAIGASGAVMGVLYSSILFIQICLCICFFPYSHSGLDLWNYVFVIFNLWNEKKSWKYWA